MLETFAQHLALVHSAFGKFGSCAPGWEEAMRPEKLAGMLVFSFLQDIREALEYMYSPIFLRAVGDLQREKDAIRFSPDVLLPHEAKTKQCLLGGAFWKVLARVDTLKEALIKPVDFSCVVYHEPFNSRCLNAVAKRMIEAIQRSCFDPDPFLRKIFLETLWNGLCVAVHDAICCGAGIYLEGIGTFTHSLDFEPDHDLLARLRSSLKKRIPGNGDEESPCCFPETRKKNFNRHWWGSGGK